MDRFRPAQNNKADDPRSSSAFTPPSIIRPESASASAFSKPILPSSSSLLSPKTQFGAPISTSNGFRSLPGQLTTTVHYRECLHNHAAPLGGHITDGCGEFMPACPTDPLKCAACGCHRSFHRRVSPKPDNPKLSSSPYRVPLLIPSPNPNLITNSRSSSEDKNNGYAANTTHVSNVDGYQVELQSREARKKRFRTKFSPEQKEKMRAFAGRVGWRIHKKNEGEMERFCNEIGVSRQVVKVWMHNNKHLVIKKQDGDADQVTDVKVEGKNQNQVDVI